MVKRFRKPDTVEAYNAAGFRERYAMENGILSLCDQLYEKINRYLERDSDD